MGTWGTSIFSDDYTSDIKREYQTLLAFGISNEEALNKIMAYFNVDSRLNDCRFWFAIASIQLKYKCLDKCVADTAIDLINKGGDVEEWKEDDDKKKRRIVLEKLKHEIITYVASDSKIKIPKPKVNKANWKVGDILSYRLINNRFAPFYNKYIGLQIVNIRKTAISHIMPELAADEWMEAAMFDYIDERKPERNELIKSGFRPIYHEVVKYGEREVYKYFNVITFVYNPYRGNISKYDDSKTTKILYDIEFLGNQRDLRYPTEMLEKRAGMYDEIECVMSRYPEYHENWLR